VGAGSDVGKSGGSTGVLGVGGADGGTSRDGGPLDGGGKILTLASAGSTIGLLTNNSHLGRGGGESLGHELPGDLVGGEVGISVRELDHAV